MDARTKLLSLIDAKRAELWAYASSYRHVDGVRASTYEVQRALLQHIIQSADPANRANAGLTDPIDTDTAGPLLFLVALVTEIEGHMTVYLFSPPQAAEDAKYSFRHKHASMIADSRMESYVDTVVVGDLTADVFASDGHHIVHAFVGVHNGRATVSLHENWNGVEAARTSFEALIGDYAVEHEALFGEHVVALPLDWGLWKRRKLKDHCY